MLTLTYVGLVYCPTTLNYPTDMVCNVRIGIPTSYDSCELILFIDSDLKNKILKSTGDVFNTSKAALKLSRLR